MAFHTEAAWTKHRALITRLYSDERYTMAQVRDVLCGMGFQVNTVQVKKHLIKWNQHRNLKYADARTALHLLGPDRSTWPSSNPRFQIREREVDFQDILRHFRRNKIHDPVQWAASAQDDFEYSSHVVLIGTDCAPETERYLPIPSSTPRQNTDDLRYTADPYRLTELSQHSVKISQLVGSTVPVQIQDPDKYYIAIRAVFHAHDYFLNCVNGRQPGYKAAEITNNFQDGMRNGVYSFLRQEYAPAFHSFNTAFENLRGALVNESATAIAVCLDALNLLSKHGVVDIVQQLLRHISQLVRLLPSAPRCLSLLFLTIPTSDDCSDLCLLMLRVAAEVFETQSLVKSLHRINIENSYCGALSDAGNFEDASIRRRRLLAQQETCLGIEDFRTISTRAGLAEDLRLKGEFEAAIVECERVLGLCSCMSGTQIAEGAFRAHLVLAHAFHKRAWCTLKDNGTRILPQQTSGTVRQDLEQALMHAESANLVIGSSYDLISNLGLGGDVIMAQVAIREVALWAGITDLHDPSRSIQLDL